ncbi:MAG: DUF2283 domain-containing protein [Nanoarchaeota archaeon]
MIKESISLNMSSTNFSWDYSEKSDILNIRTKDKKTEGSAELGDFTIDFDKNKQVIGIEIANASDFFSQADISKDQLKELKSAELVINKKGRDYTFIWVKTTFSHGIELKLPIPTPIAA